MTQTKAHPIAWAAIFAGAVAVAVIAFELATGHNPTRVEGPGGLAISFQEPGAAGASSAQRADLNTQQSKLETRLQDLNANAAARARSSPDTTAADLSGTWYGPAGYVYTIWQHGSYAVIQESYGQWITAIGQGQVSGGYAQFSYQAFNGVVGTATLARTSANALQGQFLSTAGTVPVVLTRQ